MSALVVIIKNDCNAAAGSPARRLIDEFLQLEMPSSGHRLLVVSASEGDAPLLLSPEFVPTFQTRALTLNFVDVGLSDTRAIDLLKGIVSDYDSSVAKGEIRRGHLIESISLTGNNLSKTIAPATVALLSHNHCRLTAIDLSFNNFGHDEWLVIVEVRHALHIRRACAQSKLLAVAMGHNNECFQVRAWFCPQAVAKMRRLKFLDMRQHAAVADIVFATLGHRLLASQYEGSQSGTAPSASTNPQAAMQRPALCHVRCNAFEVLPGAENISFAERALGRGAIALLAGILRANSDIRRLDLTASGVDDHCAALISQAVFSNTNLVWLGLRHNLIGSLAQSSLLAAIADARSSPGSMALSVEFV